MSEDDDFHSVIDEIALKVEQRIKRTERVLGSDGEFAKGRRYRRTGIWK